MHLHYVSLSLSRSLFVCLSLSLLCSIYRYTGLSKSKHNIQQQSQYICEFYVYVLRQKRVPSSLSLLSPFHLSSNYIQMSNRLQLVVYGHSLSSTIYKLQCTVYGHSRQSIDYKSIVSSLQSIVYSVESIVIVCSLQPIVYVYKSIAYSLQLMP